MRIYEIAKEAGVSSADVLEAAKAAGVAASSAISNVNGDEAGKLREALKGADAAAVAAKRQQKMSKAAELNAQFFAEQRVKLDEHLRIAKEAAEGKKSKSGVVAVQRNDENSTVRLPTTPTAISRPKAGFTGWSVSPPSMPRASARQPSRRCSCTPWWTIPSTSKSILRT